MGDFFKPWGRKVGAATLLLALIFTNWWVIGRSVRDEFTFGEDDKLARRIVSDVLNTKSGWFVGQRHSNRFHQLIIANGIIWRTIETLEPDGSIGYSTGWRTLYIRSDSVQEIIDQSKTQWRWQSYGFDFGEVIDGESKLRITYSVIPHWLIAIPLTLISAFLLLTNPRKSNQRKIVEPIPVEGS